MGEFTLQEVLRRVVELEASDLHLSVGSPPIIRLDGELREFPDPCEPLSAESLRELVGAMQEPDLASRFKKRMELDLAYSVPGLARFRVNLYQQRGQPGAAFRRIDNEIRSLDSLRIPQTVRDFAFLPRGLVLVTGPTGSGKTTTLASIIDVVNSERRSHVMTVEDPIEFLHRPKKSMVNQREVGTDTRSFAAALKHVLRQDPDVILIGELRDHESMAAALTAAETGHLVFATLHTVSAAQTIERIIDVFPPHQQGQIRTQLAGSLKGVLTQTLLKRKGGGRVVATEMLRATSAISRLIREGETHQIYSSLQSGAEHGMHTLDQSLVELVRKGEVEVEEARDKAGNPATFELLLGEINSENFHSTPPTTEDAGRWSQAHGRVESLATDWGG